MSMLPPQHSMGTSSPLVKSGYELVTQEDISTDTQWQIVGDDSQLLAVLLGPGQSVMTEPGALLSSSGFIQPELDMGGVGFAFQRCCCAQESCFRTHYTNSSDHEQHVTFSPAYPAKVVPVDMDKHTEGFVLTKVGGFSAEACLLYGRGNDWPFRCACVVLCCMS